MTLQLMTDLKLVRLSWRQDGEWRSRSYRSSDHRWREAHGLLAREGAEVKIHYIDPQ